MRVIQTPRVLLTHCTPSSLFVPLPLSPSLPLAHSDIYKLKAIFNKIDSDGNGFITEDELYHALDAFGITAPEQTVRRLRDR